MMKVTGVFVHASRVEMPSLLCMDLAPTYD